MTRKVEQPALFGGVDCLGESSKEVECNVDSCPGILIQYVKNESHWILVDIFERDVWAVSKATERGILLGTHTWTINGDGEVRFSLITTEQFVFLCLK